MWLLIDDVRDLNTDAIARTPEAGQRSTRSGKRGGSYHAGVVAHVLRLERRHLQAQVAVVPAQRSGEPAFAGAAGGAQHHDAAGRARICGEVSDFCHGRNDTRYTQGTAPSGSQLFRGACVKATHFVAALERMVAALLFHTSASPVQTGPSRNGANHVATD